MPNSKRNVCVRRVSNGEPVHTYVKEFETLEDAQKKVIKPFQKMLQKGTEGLVINRIFELYDE